MTKITLTDLVNLQNENTAVNAINTNNAVLEAAFDNTLSRDGTAPNTMLATLDMNSHQIINLPTPTTSFSPLRVIDRTTLNGGGTINVLPLPTVVSPYFETRVDAAAFLIPVIINSIIIAKYATGYIRCDAPYTRGGTLLPFTDAFGAQWGLDVSAHKVEAYWFGCKQDGVTDDTVAFQTCVTNSAGCEIRVRGKIGLSNHINLVTDTSIVGNNRHTSGFLALGTSSFTTFGMLYINNVSNIKLDNLYFGGNLFEPVAYAAGAMKIAQDHNSPNMTDYAITRCYFENFRVSSWIGIFMESVDANVGRVGNITISDNYVLASASCATTFAQTGNNGSVFLHMFGGTLNSSTQGVLYNLTFSGNHIDGPGLGSAVSGFNGISGVSIVGNTTINMGSSALPTDFSYTYLFYNTGITPTLYPPRNISITGNSGYRHHNNAVYLQGIYHSSVTGNSFQFATAADTILTWNAAIGLNGCRNVSVTGNSLVDSFGVSVSGMGNSNVVGDQNDTITVSGNTIQSSLNSPAAQIPYGVIVQGFSTTLDGLVNISGNSIKMTGTNAVGVIMFSPNFMPNVKIANNIIEASFGGIHTQGTTNFKNSLDISGNHIYGALSSYAMDLNPTSGALHLNGNVVDCTTASFGTVRLSGEMYINGLTIRNRTVAGDCLGTSGIGNMQGVAFPKCTSNLVTAGSTLGLVVPTWSGKVGDFVQNLGPAEFGSVSSKVIITGWTCTGGTTWLSNRVLTGN